MLQSEIKRKRQATTPAFVVVEPVGWSETLVRFILNFLSGVFHIFAESLRGVTASTGHDQKGGSEKD